MRRWPRKSRLYYGLFGGAAIAAAGALVTYKELQDLGSSPWPSHPMFHPKHTQQIHHSTPTSRKKLWGKLKRDFVLWFPLLHSSSHDPETLLTLCNAADPKVRWMGVEALASRQPWTDAEYAHVASLLDKRTLIGVSRCPNADPRLVLPLPPPSELTNVTFEAELRDLLQQLPTDDIDLCTLFFTSSALTEKRQHASGDKLSLWTFDGNDVMLEREVNTEQSTLRLHMLALQILLGYSKETVHCERLIELDGLSYIQRMMMARPDNIAIQRRVARILANLTAQPGLQYHVINAGWVSVLADWMKSSDLVLSTLASKALSNLDSERADAKARYLDGVYIYHPQYRDREPVHADIIFVHGLLGGPFRTWRQQDPPKPERKRVFKRGKEKEKEGKGEENGSEKKGEILPELDTLEHMTDIDKKQKKDSENNKENKRDTTNNVGLWKSKNNAQKIAEEKRIEEETDLVTNDCIKCQQEKTKEEKKESSLPASSLNMPMDIHQEGRDHPYTQCWPKDWLAGEIPNCRIMTVEYDSQLSEWAPTCPFDSEKRLVHARAVEMLEKLKAAGVGDRPIVWVGHSMGGLLIKQMLVLASTDPQYENIMTQSEGLVFFSVPHRGSPLAAYTRLNKYVLFPSVEVKELRQDCPTLLVLHKEFEELMQERSIPLLSFSEGQKTQLPLNVKLLMVPSHSSDPGFGEHYILEERNHLNICKPGSRSSRVYRRTKSFILSAIGPYSDDIRDQIDMPPLPSFFSDETDM